MLPKKALILVVSLALLAALFTGCWSGRGNNASTQTPGSSGSQSGGMSGSLSGGMGSSSSGMMNDSSSGVMGDLSDAIRDGMSDVRDGMDDMRDGMTGSSSMGNAGSGANSGTNSGTNSGSTSGTNSGSTSGANSGTSSGMNSGSTSGSGMSSVPSSGSVGAAAAAAAPADADAWATRLVNAQNPLPENFTVETVNISGYDERLFDKRAAPDLEALLADAEAAGCKLYLVSGYRSVERQTALFERKTNAFLAEGFDRAEAERQAAMWVARPGTSEHNTGLAADIVSADWYSAHDDLTADFEETPEFAWLFAHCAEYGFILRYPQGKENITGVTYEPWHYRYVGREAAAEIMQAGSTLEEYKGAAD